MIYLWLKPFRVILLFGCGILGACLLASCHQDVSLNDSQPLTATNCHWVNHAAGRTCVPNQIERLVTLDAASFENALALGLKPMATASLDWTPTYHQEEFTDVVDLGQSDQPNLERLPPLKPDLILGLGGQEQVLYGQASQIAPTVLIDFDYSGQWKDVFLRYSQVLNRIDIGRQAMDAYEDRLQVFKQRFRDQFKVSDSEPFEVSVVRVYPEAINLYFRESFIGIILQDAGLSRPRSQDIDAAAAYQRYRNQIQAPISLERIDQADGDVIFVWTAEEEATAPTAQKKLKELQANPLWQNLEAVQNDRVYVVPKYWIGSGPIAANAVVDDLFKHLLKDS
ncbi:periplasmic binding protein [Leptolyngbya sp. Heron Island J]|uniref:iron-siderophore ABC transporter substrate-binding protein n=1 Tax=Leptolyngbya sp. Heron Island J TaxID=1385935 RepID=UPI0003B993A8|nr:iron-siderophore ABC transporter substrate-binding protein [Leptolyngbya sp. Heron Island J]ESA33726.1 periplasmic binding protein [Leptolyngbya sp. Heron Island J]